MTDVINAPRGDGEVKTAKAPTAKGQVKLHGHGFGTRTVDTGAGQFSGGKFGRMFADLAPLLPSETSLVALGEAMVEDTTPGVNNNNPHVPAGYTYLGQFIDHDITFDPTALGEVLDDPVALRNFRTPSLELDSVYGAGPSAQPYLYDRHAPDKFSIGATSATPGGGDPNVKVSLPFDLPRAPSGFALIGDPRNDENLVVAQTHLAFLRFHNKLVDWFTADPTRRRFPITKSLFEETRDTVIWHYQWIVLHDFLRRLLNEEQLDLVINGEGERFYTLDHGKGAYIPLEFSVAAYRFGHSMVREAYSYNRVFAPGGVTPATLALLFRFSGLSSNGDDVPIPSDWIIDWRRFFKFDGAGDPGLSRRLDAALVDALHNLPIGQPTSLAVRNLLRGRMLRLPSGQRVAAHMGFTPLTPAELASGPGGAVAQLHNLDVETPLWFYLLKEAEVKGQGLELGPVGSRLVAEVFVGLIRDGANSFMDQPNWKPFLPVMPSNELGEFTMADLLHFTGDVSPIDDPANINP
jgi:hypothetical protein